MVAASRRANYSKQPKKRFDLGQSPRQWFARTHAAASPPMPPARPAD
jgi:hypothetical protein